MSNEAEVARLRSAIDQCLEPFVMNEQFDVNDFAEALREYADLWNDDLWDDDEDG